MPETGPRAPARTLVAVRAMVPVTQRPPNRAEPILAKPCATSSQLDRCRRPVMPSATTADSSDSIAPSSANAIASGSTACAFASENAGKAGHGNSRGMPPNRVPMVSTGSDKRPGRERRDRPPRSGCRASSAAARASAAMIMMLTSATATAGIADGMQRARQRLQLRNQFARLLAGSVMPSRSLNWLAKMMTAMPAVNPTVTG